MPEPIVFVASVYRITTLADGGIRVYLDLLETDILAAAHLMECKRQGIPGDVVFKPNVTICGNETEKRAEGSGLAVGNRRIEIRRNQ